MKSAMIDISVIIVNFNVKHFLDQCLHSVLAAKKELAIEVIVVDNDSIDGSVEYVKEHFPKVNVIANKTNDGFAKANNQAIRQAKGKYVLLLNPDTIIEENTLHSCFAFMEENPGCGASGVRMIDGEGKFLPESKRGFPTPFTSLMRLTGLSRLFPKSKFFNKYNLGYLSELENHEIDVLCGAFMFIRKKALDEVGILDEAFFMYGEDIDLSYRIQQGSYSIYYLASSTIVHFKGESTKKSSLKYYTTFYRAMAIFARKHYGGKGFNPFLWLINSAIFFTGLSDYIWKQVKRLLLPVLEFILFFAVLHLVEYSWARWYYQNVDYYQDFNRLPVYLLYSATWVVSLWISGSYRSLFNSKRFIFGVAWGSLIILMLYGLMDNEYRNSRAIILLASFASLVFAWLLRRFFVAFQILPGERKRDQENRVVVIGNENDRKRAQDIFDAGNKSNSKLLGLLAPDKNMLKGKAFLQSLDKLEQVVDVYKINEVLFSADRVEMKEIMKWMTILGSKVRIKILSREVQSIIGSHDRNSRGDLYTVELRYNINLAYNRFAKWLFDYIFSIIMLLPAMLMLFTFRNKLIKAVFEVLFRKKTWVSYIPKDRLLSSLPRLNDGILIPIAYADLPLLEQDELHSINFYYAKDYSFLKDLSIVLVNFSGLFRK